MVPENTLTIKAVASAIPSIAPTVKAPAPRDVTRNNGSRLWIISDETSISRLVKPSTQIPAGRARTFLVESWRVMGSFGMFDDVRRPCYAFATARPAALHRHGRQR